MRIRIYAGQYYDAETGMHYNYHRYYDPGTGRYLTPDPIGLEGGINLYAYVLNNPVNYVDPWGLQRGRKTKREFYRRQQRDRYRELRNIEKGIRQFDPHFRYQVLRSRSGNICEEEVENLREILREHQARRQAEFYESLQPRPRTRDRIQTLQDAIEQLEGVSRQRDLTPSRVQSIQKSIDRLNHELNRLQNLTPPHRDYNE